MKEIESSCHFEMSDNVTAEIKRCGDAGELLLNETTKCMNPKNTSAESCTCIMSLSNDIWKDVKDCDIKDLNQNSADAKKKCTKGISLAGWIKITLKPWVK